MPLSPEKISTLDDYFAAPSGGLTPEKITTLDDYFSSPPKSGSEFWHGLLPNDPTKEYGEILPFSKDKASGEVNLAMPNAIRSVTRGIGDLYDSAENQSTNMTPDSVNAAMAIAPLAQLRFGMPAANANIIDDIKDAPRLLGRLLKSESSVPDDVSKPPSFSAEQYQKGIGDTVTQAQASRKPFYDFMNKAAQGYTIDAPPILNNAKSLLAENESNPFQQGAVTRLKKFVEQYDGAKSIPLADAVEFKQDINSLYKPNAYDQGKNSAYFQLGNKLGSAIDSVAETNPTFAKARALADQNHVDNVATAFKNNELLSKIWQPEDHAAHESIAAGRLSYLPDETMLRQRQMVNNIKTPEHLDAVTRLMPPDMAAAFRQEVLKNVKSGGVAYRFNQLGNALGEPFKSPKHIFNAAKGQSYSTDEKVLMSAANKESPQLTTAKLAQRLMELKDKSKQPPMLALPAPSMVTDRYGVTTTEGFRQPLPDEYGVNAPQSPFTPNSLDMQAAAKKTSPVFEAQEATKNTQMEDMFRNADANRIKQLIAESLQKSTDAGLSVSDLGKKLAELLASGGEK